MSRFQSAALFLLRIALGWLFFYAGITKVLDPSWTAAGYIGSAKTFPAFFELFLNPTILPFINIFNAWGLTLVGISLLLGLFTRAGSLLGVLFMITYYLPALDFPYPNNHSFIVDEHIMYSLAFIILFAFNAGTLLGLDGVRHAARRKRSISTSKSELRRDS